VAVDIYTCGGLDPRIGFESLADRLGASSCRVQEIVRGLPDELDAAAILQVDDVQIMSQTAPLKEWVPATAGATPVHPSKGIAA
jgi:hypothetical protein